MSQRSTSPREKAEAILLRALEATETHYQRAISEESGNLSRLDLVDRYAAALNAISSALRTVSTESP